MKIKIVSCRYCGKVIEELEEEVEIPFPIPTFCSLECLELDSLDKGLPVPKFEEKG